MFKDRIGFITIENIKVKKKMNMKITFFIFYVKEYYIEASFFVKIYQ